ncbi:site-specific DNA-methyltransferase [Alloalcanivorax venustensis]|nr:site-specific DNA-methyltransferase [Alloalcanivorax venustensis]
MPQLSWYKREEDLTRAALTPYRLLQPVSSLSYGEPYSPNMLIEGNNLDALKALLPYYAGQVRCIFIDPPYNTRNAFEHYDDNIEHSQWLSMIYPRLDLLRELLSKDGSIWITIDDNESHYLKVICDEIFGRANFVNSVVWEKDAGRKNDTDISSSHDYVLIYARDRKIWKKKRNLLDRTEEQKKRYKNPDKDPKGPWRQGADGTAKSGSESLRYEITLPSGRVVTPPSGNFWRFSRETFEKARLEDRVYFGRKGDSLPVIKKYLSDIQEGIVPKTWWPSSEVGSNQGARRDHLRKLLPDIEPFATPKPEQLLQRIIQIATNPGDIVLDSFLGSGTTAAVAQKMGRPWIGIEMGKHARSHCLPRLKKVIDGEQGGISEAVGWVGGGGFRFFKLGPPVFDENGCIHKDISFEHLAAHVWFSETGTGRSTLAARDTFLGSHDGIGYYLLYNGILGDDSKVGGNVLTRRILRSLPKFDGPKVIYGEASSMTQEQLDELEIIFKQTPYDIKA